MIDDFIDQPSIDDERQASILRIPANGAGLLDGLTALEREVVDELAGLDITISTEHLLSDVKRLVFLQESLYPDQGVCAETLAIQVRTALNQGMKGLLACKSKTLLAKDHEVKLQAIAQDLMADYIKSTKDLDTATEYAVARMDHFDYSENDQETILEFYRDSF